ncbi:MAG: undecaprenyl-diphosphate phosphatase, partial [Planctomycetaceae bacterium]
MLKPPMPGSQYIEAILLGIVQGITEFLPVSSSGHFVILKQPLEEWLGTQASGKSDLELNVALHLGTLLSILWVYRADLIALPRRPRLCGLMIVATVPLVIVG